MALHIWHLLYNKNSTNPFDHDNQSKVTMSIHTHCPIKLMMIQLYRDRAQMWTIWGGRVGGAWGPLLYLLTIKCCFIARNKMSVQSTDKKANAVFWQLNLHLYVPSKATPSVISTKTNCNPHSCPLTLSDSQRWWGKAWPSSPLLRL